MEVIYLNCTNGISGDMAFAALKGLLGENSETALGDIEKFRTHSHRYSEANNHEYGQEHEHSREIGHSHDDAHKHSHGELHGYAHGHSHEVEHPHEHSDAHKHSHGEAHTHAASRHESSYSYIKNMIESSPIKEGAKQKALSIYAVIAKAEASVHGTTVENVHFHEVGRAETIENIVGAAICADVAGAGGILCSAICDGSGFIECSHGTIPVPVPAVMAMREDCGLSFITDYNISTEMVTPSGLAILIGLGARYSAEIPEGRILKSTVAFGKRETGKNGGLAAYLIDMKQPEFNR